MDEPLTRDDFDTRLDASFAELCACFAEFRADIRRAFWIQTVVIIAGIGAIIVLVEALG